MTRATPPAGTPQRAVLTAQHVLWEPASPPRDTPRPGETQTWRAEAGAPLGCLQRSLALPRPYSGPISGRIQVESAPSRPGAIRHSSADLGKF